MESKVNDNPRIKSHHGECRHQREVKTTQGSRTGGGGCFSSVESRDFLFLRTLWNYRNRIYDFSGNTDQAGSKPGPNERR